MERRRWGMMDGVGAMVDESGAIVQGVWGEGWWGIE